jgi:hypothetical protein
MMTGKRSRTTKHDAKWPPPRLAVRMIVPREGSRLGPTMTSESQFSLPVNGGTFHFDDTGFDLSKQSE